MAIDMPFSSWRTLGWRWISALGRELDEGGLNLRAKGMVYSSLLSLAPLLAVSFAVLKAFGVHNQLKPFLLQMLAPLGDQAEPVTANVIGFVENIQVGVLGFVGLATLFYTVVSLLGEIEESFNHIWRIAAPRRLARRFADYLSVILVGPVLMVSALGITASMSSHSLVRRLVALEPFGTAYYLAGLALPYVLISLAFAFFYAFIPNTRVRARPALIGGITAGVAWKLTGSLFTALVANSAQYSAIYSGFAVVLVFMIWLYVNWLVLLLGATVAFYCQYPRYLQYTARQPRLSIAGQEQAGLLLMALISRSQIEGEPAWTLHRLADAVHLPWETVAGVLDTLHQAQLLRALDHDADSYVPVRDTDRISADHVLTALRTAGETPEFADLRQDPATQRLLEQYARNAPDSPWTRSLREFVQAPADQPPRQS